jgi:hypothetical protein
MAWALSWFLPICSPGGPISGADRLDKVTHPVVILDALRAFDAAGDVDAPGEDLGDGSADGLGREPTGEQESGPTGEVGRQGPVGYPSGATEAIRMVGIEKESRGGARFAGGWP